MTRHLPSEAMGDTRTRVLLAVVNQWHPTVRSVAAEAGVVVSVAHWHLEHLRSDGLVTWEEDRRGTLRPLVEEVLPSHERPYDGGKIGSENGSGPATASTAPDRAQHRSRRR